MMARIHLSFLKVDGLYLKRGDKVQPWKFALSLVHLMPSVPET